jgi:hypothetical protein
MKNFFKWFTEVDSSTTAEYQMKMDNAHLSSIQHLTELETSKAQHELLVKHLEAKFALTSQEQEDLENNRRMVATLDDAIKVNKDFKLALSS